MTGIWAAVTLLATLLLLEWLFWLSPLTLLSDRVMRRMGDLYMVLPHHYWARIIALGAVLIIFRPGLRFPFEGGMSWLRSLLLGIFLSAFQLWACAKLYQISPRSVLSKALQWHRENPADLWTHLAYITVYPGLVEELLFRWFFVAALWPALGWWTALLAPVINLVWHLPVWIDMVRKQATDGPTQRRLLLQVAGPATLLALLLTLITVPTQNLLGAVIAHTAGDLLGSVMRRRSAAAEPAA